MIKTLVVDWVCEILVKQIKKVVVVHQRCRFHAQSKRNVDFQGVILGVYFEQGASIVMSVLDQE